MKQLWNKLTTAQALKVLKNYQILDDNGNIHTVIAVMRGVDCIATLQTFTPEFDVNYIVGKAHKAVLWRFASAGDCSEDGLDITINDTCFSFRINPVLEIPEDFLLTEDAVEENLDNLLKANIKTCPVCQNAVM
ncbi:MAG: hypothetical protein ACKOXV_06630 [Bacteroidota bacterium]